MTTYSFSTLTNNQHIAFDPLRDVLFFDTAIRPAELLINGTSSGVQFSVGGKSIVLDNVALDDLGLSALRSVQNVGFVSPGTLFVGEGTTAHNGDGANVIFGSTGDDALLGLGGNDTLDGAAGKDLMVGGLGDDTYRVDNAADIVTEENNSTPDAGHDIVIASVNYTLTNYVEDLLLIGPNAINGTGNALDNSLNGNASDNVLDGKIGADLMTGYDGNDTYVVDDLQDKVYETNASATQIDTVNAGVSWKLGANLENLLLTGILGLTGVGNFRDNQMTGNTGSNTLNGGYGADTMTGGDGNDTFIVDNAGDRVIEINNSTAQIDLVASSVSYILGANLENLRLLGSGNIDGTGNALNNVLAANAGNNVLDGQGGNDTASYASVTLFSLVSANPVTATLVHSTAMAGVMVDLNIIGAQDTQGSGRDTLISIENLTGSAFDDELTGNAAVNVLDGGGGADLLTGGRGSDIYIVDGADVVVEFNGAAEGIDTVQSSVSYRLTANVEYLVLTGTALYGIGNNLDNRLTGNSGANFLDGRAGADKMDGGQGNDTFVVDNLGDEITDASGTDLVLSYININLGGTIENLRLMGTNALDGTGNALNNMFWANTGDNVMNGGGETLVSGIKGDTLSYEYGATSGITLDLANQAAQQTGGSGSDTVINFENVIGSAYDDLLAGNAAANILDGFLGEDTVSYAAAGASVTVDLTLQQAITDGIVDTVRNFENIVGSAYGDLLIGDLGNNAFDGGNGRDTVSYENVREDEGGVVVNLSIQGAQNTLASGWDTFVPIEHTTRSTIENITGSVNNDSLTGDMYANQLDGSSGNDTLRGGVGDDSLMGGEGNDQIFGGLGDDTGLYLGERSVVVDLNLTGPQDTGYGRDTLSSVESLTSGSGNDLLTGNTANNVLNGGLGQDTLLGGAGDDVLVGGSGLDRLTGNTGMDTFVFDTDIGPGNIDRITDFKALDDTIQLENAVFTGLFKGTLLGQAFASNSTGLADDTTDRIIYDKSTGNLYFDADGLGGTAGEQFAVIASGLTLTNADFFVI